MREDLLAQLEHELNAYRSSWEDPVRRASLIEGALPRIAATLDLLPPATRDGHLLELGSEPFLTSQCLDIVWPGRITHANYFGTAERRGRQTVVDAGGTLEKTYEYDLFSIETDEFPYPDGAFDVVIFSELVEHLATNPVWALAEMHRVLKSGGHLIITTPNALSIDRLESVVTGARPMVDRYNPAFGYGARHNREYTAPELRILLEETGFDVETMVVRDLEGVAAAKRLRHAALRLLLRAFSRESHRAHIFIRARRRSIFRWQFPPALFEQSHWYVIVRHPWVEMGANDTIQCGPGWEPVQEVPGGTGWMRRIRWTDDPLPGGSALLRGVAGHRRVVVRLRGERGDAAGRACCRIAVAKRHEPDPLLGYAKVAVSNGDWTEVQVPLVRAAVDGEHLNVNLAVEPGHEVAVQRIALVDDAAR